jgi:hypothetical protein
MESKSLLNRSNILTSHKPLGQDLPNLHFMWPLGAQPLNILDTSIQQKRQHSFPQGLSLPFAKSPFFSTRSASTIQRRRNASQDDLNSLNFQPKREYSNIDISSQIPQSVNELEYSENVSENLVDDQLSFDDNQAFVDAANFSGEIDVNPSTRPNEIANPQQSIELSSSIPTPRISPQVQPDSISLSKPGNDSIIFPINEDSSANHDTSTNLDVDEDLGLQDNPIDLPTETVGSVDSPIYLNLKTDQNSSAAFSASPPIESYPEPSIQESTISTTPVPLILSSSAQSEVVPRGYKQIENPAVNDIPESPGVDVGLDSTSNQIHRQSEIQAPIDIANTSDISTSSIAPTTVPSQLELISVSADSEADLEPERLAEVQPSVVVKPPRSEQDPILNENKSGENNSPDLISSVDSDSSIINASSSSEASSNSIFQDTISTAHQEPDSVISDFQNLTSPISTDISDVIAASPIAPPQSPQVDRKYLSPQASSQDTEDIGIAQFSNSNNDTILFESSLDSSIISPQFESEIQTSPDINNNLQLPFKTDELSLAEPLRTNTQPDLGQSLNAISNSESEASEVQLTPEKSTGSDVSSSFFTENIGQEFELYDTSDFVDSPSAPPRSITDLVASDRAINQSIQPLVALENIDISTGELAPSINRSSVDETSAPPGHPIQLSPDVEEFDPFDPAPEKSNTTDFDLSLQAQPQQLRSAETDFGVPGRDLDTLSSTIDIQPSSLSIAPSLREPPESVSESSETSFIALSTDTSSSTINSNINQTVVDFLPATNHPESTGSYPSSIQEENITETGLVNNPVQRRIEPTAESTSIDLPLVDSINRFSDPASSIDQESVNAKDADRSNQLPEINHKTLDSADVLETETQQLDDFELATPTTSVSDDSGSLPITTAMPQVLQKLSILDPQLTQSRRSGQSTNTPLNFNPPLLSTSPSARIQRSTSTTIDRMGINSESYSPVLQQFSAGGYNIDRFDDPTHSSDVTSSWGSISDLLNSSHIDGNPNSFTSAGSPGQPIIQPKSIRQSIPIWNEDGLSPEPLDANQPFVNLRPYDSLPQPISSVQDTEPISSNPITQHIAKFNSEPQPIFDQNSIMEPSEQSHSTTYTDADANKKDNNADLEQLAQITYQLIRQKIAIERERAGGYYSGRLPW